MRTAGAELLVRNASTPAAADAISSRMVGLTLLAFRTCAPKLLGSIRTSLVGQPDVAMESRLCYVEEIINPHMPGETLMS